MTATGHGRRSPQRGARLAAAALIELGRLASAPIAAGARAATRNPRANVAPNPNYDDCSKSGLCKLAPPCYSASFAPQFSSGPCEQKPGASGCWGHRDNILGRYPTATRFAAARVGAALTTTARRHTVLVMGAGSRQPNGAGRSQRSRTEQTSRRPR
ncbi:MAG TPA: hypothetical protein VHM72_02075 [Solirubrobacteraceae bacterium]|nr:hypothetical protein [Solirubrobacteraceae bacterium]